MVRQAYLLGAAAAAVFWASSAGAADLQVGTGHYSDECAQSRHLSRITSRFAYQVKNVPDLPDVSIMEFRDLREQRYLPEDEDHQISRRYCAGTVVLSDGHAREIWYLIEGRMGFVGIGDNVEFCVSGFDRWYVYNGGCRVLQ
jgi:capsid protein